LQNGKSKIQEQAVSSVTRTAGVLLALIQLGVWGLYAPVHRLHHLALPDSAVASPCFPRTHAHCCSHHAESAEAPATHSSEPGVPCPDDEQHCEFCALAILAATMFPAVSLTAAGSVNEGTVGLSPQIDRATRTLAFDSRGPPQA